MGAAKALRARGFTYFTVLILVAIMGAGLAAIGTLWQQVARREKESELLFVGGEFRRAIGTYFERSPGAPQYPRSLEDLLVDKRLPVVGRHLRKIYFDPMTRTQDWGLVKEPGGGILGVYSKGTDKPLKTARFREEDKGFATALSYADWKFVYGTGSLLGPTPGAQQGVPSLLAPPAGDQGTAVPIAPPSDSSSSKDDPAREARRAACEKQREREAGACEALGLAATQNPEAVGCTAGVAERFTTCMDGAAPAAAPAASTAPAG
jgi:type II secretory pathway pseudopilin PulG